MTAEELFNHIGSNVDEVLTRFGGNRAMLDRFLRKFPDDRTYAELKNSVEAGNSDNIERDAHTLKGLAANLGFVKLSRISADMVLSVRESRSDRIEPDFCELSEEYEKIVKCISELQ